MFSGLTAFCGTVSKLSRSGDSGLSFPVNDAEVTSSHCALWFSSYPNTPTSAPSVTISGPNMMDFSFTRQFSIVFLYSHNRFWAVHPAYQRMDSPVLSFSSLDLLGVRKAYSVCIFYLPRTCE